MQRTTFHDRMDLIKSMLVFAWLCTNYQASASQLNVSTDRPAPSAETTEFARQPLILYAFDSSKSIVQTIGDANSSSPSETNKSRPDEATQPSETGNSTTTEPPTLSTTIASTTTLPVSNAPVASGGSHAPQAHCTLGDDTFQIGERWNPNLPPFGVQVCVLCECTIRPRKNCYESKVTCRRITNECPIIDSCPDGKKPVTVAGQCCKSCQSTSLSVTQQESNLQMQQHQPLALGSQSPAYESQASKGVQAQQQTPYKIVYMNERTKEYLSLVKSLPACPIKDSENRPVSSNAPTSPTPSLPLGPKTARGNRNDLNGIDTKLAFKSLHDTAANHHTQSRQRPEEPARRLEHSSSEDHHQHPNDVQSASSSNINNNNVNQYSNYGRTRQYNSSDPSAQNCVLGNDTFQVGDVWNPVLPPFGVQVCVRCNCIYRLRKGCYETKVTCRRINKDCPVIDSCPDGEPPVTVSGQCCKSCPTLIAANNAEQEPIDLTSNGGTATIPPFQTLDGIQRNEKIFREFQSISRNLNVCIRTRESIDIYNTNRYARRSQQP